MLHTAKVLSVRGFSELRFTMLLRETKSDKDPVFVEVKAKL